MVKNKKFILILLGVFLTCVCFIACNSSIQKTNNVPSQRDPRVTYINEIETKVKNNYYPAYSIRVFNPKFSKKDLDVSGLDSDRCWKLSVNSDYEYFLNSSKKYSLPTYCFEIHPDYPSFENAYYNSVYRDIINDEVLQNLFPHYESLDYLLSGFAYNMTIKKDGVVILSSVPKSGVQMWQMKNDDSAFGRFDPDLPDFVEDSPMNNIIPDSFKNFYKFSRYQASNYYNGVNYKTCTFIFYLFDLKDNSASGFRIMNYIKIDEHIKGYDFSYYIYDISEFNGRIRLEDYNNLQTMDNIIESLKTKTIEMAESYIDHSLDYLNE